jgi:isobutyryl-CoA mutase
MRDVLHHADHPPGAGAERQREPVAGVLLHRVLTDRVEEAVYAPFERLTERGGVLAAMESL